MVEAGFAAPLLLHWGRLNGSSYTQQPVWPVVTKWNGYTRCGYHLLGISKDMSLEYTSVWGPIYLPWHLPVDTGYSWAEGRSVLRGRCGGV